ncbi:MAG TPA: hypothetical protein VN112_20970 [Ensifer sp.]|nr:hypothetical protein [Ensifer sp.]
MNAKANFPDSETVASKLSGLEEQDKAWLKLVLENPAQDDALLDGISRFVNVAAEARFLNSLKLSRAGEWLGTHAPARLQIRLMEIGRSSQHPAYAAFREGLSKSGGLDKAWPKA